MCTFTHCDSSNNSSIHFVLLLMLCCGHAIRCSEKKIRRGKEEKCVVTKLCSIRTETGNQPLLKCFHILITFYFRIFWTRCIRMRDWAIKKMRSKSITFVICSHLHADTTAVGKKLHKMKRKKKIFLLWFSSIAGDAVSDDQLFANQKDINGIAKTRRARESTE